MAKEYIEREAVLTHLNERLNFLREENGNYDHYTDGYEEAVDKVEDFPAADVAEVVHGEWIPYKSDESYGSTYEKVWYKCSICEKDALGRVHEDEWYSSPILSDYCPKCGAKMDGERKEK